MDRVTIGVKRKRKDLGHLVNPFGSEYSLVALGDLNGMRDDGTGILVWLVGMTL